MILGGEETSFVGLVQFKKKAVIPRYKSAGSGLKKSLIVA